MILGKNDALRASLMTIHSYGCVITHENYKNACECRLRASGAPDRALAISIWDTPHADECKYEVWERG